MLVLEGQSREMTKMIKKSFDFARQIIVLFLLVFMFSCSLIPQNPDRAVENAIIQARQLMTQNKTKQAVEILEDAVEKYPESKHLARAQFQLGNLYFRSFDDFNKALETYQKIIDKEPNSNWAKQARQAQKQIFNY